jgi:hypothetical protein
VTADLPHVTVRQADQAAMAVTTVLLATAVPLATPVTATLR